MTRLVRALLSATLSVGCGGSSLDLSTADSYDIFLTAMTAGGFDAATIGDTLREGACSLGNN